MASCAPSIAIYSTGLVCCLLSIADILRREVLSTVAKIRVLLTLYILLSVVRDAIKGESSAIADEVIGLLGQAVL